MTLVIPSPGFQPRAFSGCHALVVDPILGNRRRMRDTLRDLGCASVEETGKMREAWTTLEQGGISVLFLDWSGEIDAPSLLARLRGDESPNRFLPVVVMSAYGSADEVAAIRDAGATEFMLRPFSDDIVASRLRSIVEHPRLFIQGGAYFGPDRRRRRADWCGPERRMHQNWRAADRRRNQTSQWNGPERRQGRPGFEPLERRDAPRV
ncbi:MAG: response regulator [Magnetospirillum sp.]|nr:response regulator [Magnetospirillum sp.]